MSSHDLTVIFGQLLDAMDGKGTVPQLVQKMLMRIVGLGAARIEDRTEKGRAARPMLGRADERAAVDAHGRRRIGAIAHKVRQSCGERLVAEIGAVIGRAPASALIDERRVGQHRSVAVVGRKWPRR